MRAFHGSRGAQGWAKVAVAALSVLAVICLTLSGYIYSIVQPLGMKRSDFTAPLWGTVSIGLLAIVAGAWVLIRPSVTRASIRSVVILVTGCLAVTGLLCFGWLTNCNISCGSRTLNESFSPDGRWKAIWSVENCAAPAKYCLPTSRVAVVTYQQGQPHGQAEALRIIGYEGISFIWKSNNRLLIEYPFTDPTLQRHDNAGALKIEYRTTPWM